MGKSIKLKGENYWDSTGIVHNQQKLSELLSPQILYSCSKTYSSIADDTIITLSDDIANYERIVVYGVNGNGIINNCEIYNPTIDDAFVLSIPRSGNRSGSYAYEHDYREFTITGSKQIKYGNGTQGSSRLTSGTTWYGFVSDVTTIMIYAVIGYKF